MATLEKIKIIATALSYSVVEESLCVRSTNLNDKQNTDELLQIAEMLHRVLDTGVCYDVFTVACFNQMYRGSNINLKFKVSSNTVTQSDHILLSSTRWELLYTKNNSSVVVMDRTINIIKHV
jgi:hypothetical protein